MEMKVRRDLLVLERVINREVDIGVVSEPVLSSAVRMDAIGHFGIGCLVPRRHWLTRRGVVKAEDLKSESIISYLPQAFMRPYVNRIFGEGPAPHFAIEVSSSATAIMLVSHGAGIGLIESSLFASHPMPGLALLPLEPRIGLRSLLLRPLKGAQSQVVKDFIAELRLGFA